MCENRENMTSIRITFTEMESYADGVELFIIKSRSLLKRGAMFLNEQVQRAKEQWSAASQRVRGGKKVDFV